MSDLISIERLTGSKDELQALQTVLASVPSYSVKTTGEDPTKTMAKDLFERILPEGFTAENRYLYGIYFNHKMIGCMDLMRSYPDEKTVTMTMLLISDDVQGAGLGSEAYKEAEVLIKEWKDFNRLRLEMVRTLEQVMPFWRKMGFRKTNETLNYEVGSVKSRTVVLEKNLFKGPGPSPVLKGPGPAGPNKKSKFQRNKNFPQRRPNHNDSDRRSDKGHQEPQEPQEPMSSGSVSEDTSSDSSSQRSNSNSDSDSDSDS